MRFPTHGQVWAAAFSVFFCLYAQSISAAPADPTPRQFTQPDGTTFTAIPRGDEWMNWYETPGGQILTYDRAAHSYQYAKIVQQSGKTLLESSGIKFRAGQVNARAPHVDLRKLIEAWTYKRKEAGAFDLHSGSAQGTGADSSATDGGSTGTSTPTAVAAATGSAVEFPTLIVVVEFNDQQVGSGDSVWNQKVFGGYPGTVTAGTVNDYYREISYGQAWFKPIPEASGTANDGVVRVHLNVNNPNYARDWTSWRPVLYQALEAADSSVDFTTFDTNGDGVLSKNELQVLFVVAGLDSSSTGRSDVGLWAHTWSFPSGDSNYPVLDGEKVAQYPQGRYAAIGALHETAGGGTHDATIGVICHELGHAAFLLGDLYQDFNVDYWGLMGLGSWGTRAGEYDGATPVHMLAANKALVSLPGRTGFIQPVSLTPGSQVVHEDLYSAQDPDHYQVLRLPGLNAGEYFVIENRKVAGYDEGLERRDVNAGDEGLLITYFRSKGAIKIYRAEGNGDGTRSNTNDLWFLGNNARWAPDGTPSSDDPFGGATGYVLENISAPGDIMGVDVRKEAYPCTEYTDTNPNHVSAGRAYSDTSGSGWLQTTHYYATGSGDDLGTYTWNQVTVSEIQPGYYVKGSCPATDTTAPVITLTGAADMTVAQGGTFSDPGATATDDVDGDISSRIMVTGSVDTATVGDYVLHYNVSDNAGNAAPEKTRTVHVQAQAACTDYTATPASHISAGRAHACGSYNMYACANGSGTQFGSRYSYTQTTLKETSSGYFEVGACQ